jgi:hypothetical protein
MATLQSLTISDTGYIKLPVGTGSDRPGSPVNGMIRYNTDQARMEAYTGGEWQGFPLIKTIFNYNGSDQTFTVPAGITKIWVKCWGGGGGGGGVSGWSGGGTGGGGTGAAATAAFAGGIVTSITITNGGSGYTTLPTISFTGGGGTGATATAVLTPTSITSITVTAAGSGYTSAPTVGFTGGGGTGA